MIFLSGCSSQTAKKGAALAKEGLSSAESLEKALSKVKTSADNFLVLEIATSPGFSGTESWQEVSDQLQYRVGVAKSMNSAFTALSELSEFDTKKVGAAAKGFAKSFTGFTSLIGLGKILPGENLFGWLVQAIAQAKQNRDIKEGALALRWAVHDLSCIYFIELGGDEAESKPEQWKLVYLKDGEYVYPDPPFPDPQKLFPGSGSNLEKEEFDKTFLAGAYSENKPGLLPEICHNYYHGVLAMAEIAAGANTSPDPDFSSLSSSVEFSRVYKFNSIKPGQVEELARIHQAKNRQLFLDAFGDTTAPLEMNFYVDERLRGDLRGIALRASVARTIVAYRNDLVSLQNAHKSLRGLVAKYDELFGKPSKRTVKYSPSQAAIDAIKGKQNPKLDLLIKMMEVE